MFVSISCYSPVPGQGTEEIKFGHPEGCLSPVGLLVTHVISVSSFCASSGLSFSTKCFLAFALFLESIRLLSSDQCLLMTDTVEDVYKLKIF